MTAAVSHKVPKSEKAPAINWHPTAKQYYTALGYHKGRAGKVARTYHYLGEIKGAAEAHAWRVKVAWLRIEQAAQWQAATSEEMTGVKVKVQPVWPSNRKERKALIDGTADVPMHRSEKSEQGWNKHVDKFSGPEESDLETPDYISVTEAKDRYLARCKKKVGLSEGGMNERSYNSRKRFLDTALTLKGESGEPILPPDFQMSNLDFQMIERVRDEWLKQTAKGRYAKRSVVNFLRAYKAFIDWCDGEDSIHFKIKKRADVDDLFRFRKVNPNTDIEYEPEKLKKVFKALQPAEGDDERDKLTKKRLTCFALAALNLGYYQLDIAHLSPSMVKTEGDEHFIERVRERIKHVSEQKTKVYVWPEVWASMNELRAPENPHNLWFLTQHGTPLQSGERNDAISAAWKRAELNFRFKDFRKIGATWITNNVTDGEAVANLYMAHTVKGVNASYIKHMHTRLTEALKAFREQLIKDKVIEGMATAKPK